MITQVTFLDIFYLTRGQMEKRALRSSFRPPTLQLKIQYSLLNNDLVQDTDQAPNSTTQRYS